MKTIKIELSEASINAAIKELKAYEHEINEKMLKLIDVMVQYGEDYALNAVGHVDTGETLTSVVGYRNGKKGVIVAGGNAVWLEFGTGVTNNTPVGTSPHPKGAELGLTIGSYSYGENGKQHADDPNGWWYPGGGGWKHTYGIKANMFMWRTVQELERVFPELAREVFAE